MIVRQLAVGRMLNFAYVIGDEVGGHGAIIDPAAEIDRLEAELDSHRLSLDFVFNTHSHYDHVGGNDRLRARGAKLVAHESSPLAPDVPVRDGQTVDLGALGVRILHTPGHFSDSICIVAGDYLFTGDTLFIDGCGRVDLPGSDPTAMYHSLIDRLRALPDHLVVMPGHDYGTVTQRTLGEEKRVNPCLAPQSLARFLGQMGG